MNRLSRQRRATARWIGAVATAAALTLGPGPGGADEREEARTNLARTVLRIGEITRELNGARDARAREQAALRDIELRRAGIAEQARRLGTEVALGVERVGALDARIAERRAIYLEQRARLGRNARAAYAAARRSPLALALGQDRPAALARALALHARVQREHARRVTALEASYRELAVLADNLARESRELAAARTEAARADEALETEQRERARLLERLNADVRDRDAALTGLRADAERLQSLLRELPEELRELTFDAPEREPFATLRGKLPWPVLGQVTQRFGAARGPQLRWQGVVIESEEGGEVRVVAGGRVAYADWLRGFGLLVIVEHDGGYMSLYGRNQSLFKEVGDWVEAGEVVATVGDSGGAEGVGLYFEIRRGGRPEDPLAWVRAAGAG